MHILQSFAKLSLKELIALSPGAVALDEYKDFESFEMKYFESAHLDEKILKLSDDASLIKNILTLPSFFSPWL